MPSSPQTAPAARASIAANALRAGAATALLALAACAATTPAPPEQLVAQRAAARWQALIAGDFEKAYGFTTPSYRALTPFERYRAGIGGAVTWLGAEVVRVECETEKCTAVIKIEARPMLATPYKGTITTGVDETWLLEQGQWWLYQKL